MTHTDNKSLVERVARAICYENYCPCCVTPEFIENNWEEYISHAEAAIAALQNQQPNPDMPTQQLLLHFGELTKDEILLVRAALRFAQNQQLSKPRKAVADKPVSIQTRDELLYVVGQKDAIIAKLKEGLESAKETTTQFAAHETEHYSVGDNAVAAIEQTLAEVTKMEEGNG